MARIQPPPQDLDIQNGSIYAKVMLHCGHRFGPYAIKWTNEPLDKSVAWEVSANSFTAFKNRFLQQKSGTFFNINGPKKNERKTKASFINRNCFRIINQSAHSSSSLNHFYPKEEEKETNAHACVSNPISKSKSKFPNKWWTDQRLISSSDWYRLIPFWWFSATKRKTAIESMLTLCNPRCKTQDCFSLEIAVWCTHQIMLFNLFKAKCDLQSSSSSTHPHPITWRSRNLPK